jgi:hypothetical protein
MNKRSIKGLAESAERRLGQTISLDLLVILVGGLARDTAKDEAGSPTVLRFLNISKAVFKFLCRHSRSAGLSQEANAKTMANHWAEYQIL